MERPLKNDNNTNIRNDSQPLLRAATMCAHAHGTPVAKPSKRAKHAGEQRQTAPPPGKSTEVRVPETLYRLSGTNAVSLSDLKTAQSAYGDPAATHMSIAVELGHPTPRLATHQI